MWNATPETGIFSPRGLRPFIACCVFFWLDETKRFALIIPVRWQIGHLGDS